jgi:hypothetical protein
MVGQRTKNMSHRFSKIILLCEKFIDTRVSIKLNKIPYVCNDKMYWTWPQTPIALWRKNSRQCMTSQTKIWRFNVFWRHQNGDVIIAFGHTKWLLPVWQQCYSNGRIFKTSLWITQYEVENVGESYKQTPRIRWVTDLANWPCWHSHFAEKLIFRTVNTGQDKV